jgi:tRNA (mo5U34)-methyltransferase
MAADPFAYVKNWHQEREQAGWWHSFELPDGRQIQGVSKLEALRARIAQFPIAQDLRGKRVLDVGTWDGWFAMEMERRGAEVVAIDRWENPRFHEIRELLHSRVEYRRLNVYDLDPERIGRFDIVLFLGVLYHLKHPLLALERVCSVAKDMVAVESLVLKDRHRPGLGVEGHSLMEFYEHEECGGEFDNWVAPTVPCLMGMCRTAGFVRAELNNVHEFGAAVSCYRTWGDAGGIRTGKLELAGVYHADTGGINFQSRSSDDYVSCRVAAGVDLTMDSVQAEVGGYGARPVSVGWADGYQAVNFKLPPGLAPGWHPVRLRTKDAESNSVEIAVDVPAEPERLNVRGVCDAVSWEASRISLRNGFAAVWVEGLPANADRGNVEVAIAGRQQFATFVSGAADGARQVNVQVARYTPMGRHPLQISFGKAAAAVEVEIVP